MWEEKAHTDWEQGYSTEISDDSCLNCRGLWLECSFFVHYTLAAYSCKHVYYCCLCASFLDFNQETLAYIVSIYYMRSLIGNSSWLAMTIMFL